MGFLQFCKKIEKNNQLFNFRGPILLYFINSSQIFPEGLLTIATNKIQSAFIRLHLDHDDMAYDMVYAS